MAYTPQPSPAQEILDLNNLNSGRTKAYKIRILVCVGCSKIPNQRLMLKYNPGAVLPFINCSIRTQGLE